MTKTVKKILSNVDNYTKSERLRRQLIRQIQKQKNEGCSISEISRRLNKDRRTITKYVLGNPDNMCKSNVTRKKDIYESFIIELINNGLIQKQIIDMLIEKGYSKTASNARHLIHKIVNNNKLHINKYCPAIRTKEMKTGAKSTKFTYLYRSTIFKFLWMNGELSLKNKEYIFKKYPNLTQLYKCILEFRAIYKHKNITLLYLFIEKYSISNICEISSFTKGLMRDLEAVEHSVASDLSNGFVEGTNSKLKMIKRTMYGRCSKKLLEAKLMLRLL